MPELPEVETVKNNLNDILPTFKPIKKIITYRKNLRIPFPFKQFNKITHTPLIQIRRRAKYLIFDFENTYSMISHLGMTGTWRIEKESPWIRQIHDHLCIEFLSGQTLLYNDPRRFGYIDILKTNELNQSSYFRHLGPEPLDKKLDVQALYAEALKSKQPRKVWIMNQENVVGVGNIYASESLFKSGLSPLKSINQTSQKDFKTWIQNIQKILIKSIKQGGSTLKDFKSVNGQSGYFQNHFDVYGKQGEKCPICSHRIQQITQTGRSTFYCPNCQRN